jgi:hypothetical protein
VLQVTPKSRFAKIRANELVAEAVAMLAAHGFTPSVSGKKHVKIRWSDGGRSYVLVVSRSPSNRHAQVKSRALLRRLLRANGTHREGCS